MLLTVRVISPQSSNFGSPSPSGMIEESREFVKALQKNEELQKAFLKLLTSPHQRTNLDKLAACVSSFTVKN